MFAALYWPSMPDAVPRDALARIARDFSPRIEVLSPSLVLIDISGLDRLLGEPRAIGEELQRAAAAAAGVESCTALDHPRIAIAATRTTAQVLAQTAAGLVVIDWDGEAAAIAPLPLHALTRIGAPLDLVTTLERWGLRTLGAFAALPPAPLASRLGQAGLVWQRLARGEDPRPLVPSLPEERFEAMLDLEWPIEGIEPLAFVLGRLLDPVCARLELRDRAAAAIELRLRLTISRAWQMRRIELPVPMRDARMLRLLLCLDLEGRPLMTSTLTLSPGAGAGAGAADAAPVSIDRVGVFIEPTPGRVAQFSLLTRPTVAPEAVATLMARLRALAGQDRCGTARLLDTHRPGAFAMADFAGPSFSSGASETPDLKVGPTKFTKPIGPTRRGVRRLRHPIPARVTVAHGRPVRVATDRRGWAGGAVIWCAGPWRISGDWWDMRDMTPFNNDEWDVTLTDAASYRIHEDRDRSQWFVDAILD